MMELGRRGMDSKRKEVNRFNKRVKSIDLDNRLTVEMREKQVSRVTLNSRFSQLDRQRCYLLGQGMLGKF